MPIKGLVGLLLTVGLTMWAVESAFNRIWRVPAPKPKLLRFLVYWGLLTMGSLLIVSLLALNSAVSVYINLADYTPGFLDGVGLAIAPVLIGFFGLSAAYWLIPHRQVPLRHAMIGGLIATLLFELLIEIGRGEVDLDAVRSRVAAESRDDTAEAMDRVWEEEAVRFGAEAPPVECAGPRSPSAAARPHESKVM